MDVILSNQGKIQLSSEVEKILIEDGKAVGVLSGGKMIESGMVIHNAGARALLKLAGESNFPREYVERIKNLIPVECGAIIVGSREHLIRDAAILLPVGCRRIVGIFEPTFFDSTVAPPGCSMIDAFFPLKGSEVKNELDLAMDDLRMIFPRFEKNADFILPMLFHKEWPGAETAQTFGQVGEQRLSPRTPVEKLYIVGMDAVGSGVAGDLIPVGVRRALQFISKDVKSQI
jgi:phytoene dehydrogenase-like protein